LFKFDTDLIPEAIALYKDLNIKHEPLTLITPQFETPMPPLQEAVFPPSLNELPPPNLDLFYLDEQFSSERYKKYIEKINLI
jgi:intraflagellar transport protein 52